MSESSAMKHLGVRIPADLHGALEKYVEKEGISQSVAIREMLERYLGGKSPHFLRYKIKQLDESIQEQQEKKQEYLEQVEEYEEQQEKKKDIGALPSHVDGIPIEKLLDKGRKKHRRKSRTSDE